MASIAVPMIPTNHTLNFEKDVDDNECSIEHDSIPDSQDDLSSEKQHQTVLALKHETCDERDNIDEVAEDKESENKMDPSKDENNVVVIDDDVSTKGDVHNANHNTQMNNSNQQVTIDTIEYIHELSKSDLQKKEQVYSQNNQEEKIAKLKESIKQLEDGKAPLDLLQLNQNLTALNLEWDQITMRFEEVVIQTRQFL